MASREARQKAIKDAARMVRSGNPLLARAGDTTACPCDVAPPPPAKPIPGQEDIGRPAVRELFRNTVTIADEDPPRMEFRIRVQRSWQDRKSATVEYQTESKPIALVEMKYLKRLYPEGHVWLEQRPITAWTEVQ